MRITGGRFTGLRMVAPKGPPVRTTLDHVRQALFNLLGDRVEGARVLDLFSGSGALGIEALSRGAAHVTFVDRSTFSVRAIEENLDSLPLVPVKPPSLFTVVRCDAVAAVQRLGRQGEKFELVFLDPPYEQDWGRKTLIALVECAIVAPFGLVVAEHSKRDPLPPELEGKAGCLTVQRHKRYGDTALTIYGVRSQRV